MMFLFQAPASLISHMKHSFNYRLPPLRARPKRRFCGGGASSYPVYCYSLLPSPNLHSKQRFAIGIFCLMLIYYTFHKGMLNYSVWLILGSGTKYHIVDSVSFVVILLTFKADISDKQVQWPATMRHDVYAKTRQHQWDQKVTANAFSCGDSLTVNNLLSPINNMPIWQRGHNI